MEPSPVSSCSNNPVMYVDPNGSFKSIVMVSKRLIEFCVNVLQKPANDMFLKWLSSDNKEVVYGQDSEIVNYLMKNDQVNEAIGETILDFIKTGNDTKTGSFNFNGFDEFQLWMSLRECHYTIEVQEKYICDGLGYTTKERVYGRTIYVVNVTVTDIYNFNRGNEKGNGIGSILNNFGYALQNGGIGGKYNVTIQYTKTWDPVIH